MTANGDRPFTTLLRSRMTDSAFAPIPIRPPPKYRRADKLPESIARRFAHNDRFVLGEPLFVETSFARALYWHRRHSGDGGHAWLREQIANTKSR